MSITITPRKSPRSRKGFSGGAGRSSYNFRAWCTGLFAEPRKSVPNGIETGGFEILSCDLPLKGARTPGEIV
jgi:hypothetical protein